MWVIAPKAGVFATHFVTHVRGGYYPDDHNVAVRNIPVHSRAVNFLFAAFAWRIISRAKGFIVAGDARQVIQFVPTDDQNAQCSWETKRLSGQELCKKYDGGGELHARPRRSRKHEAADAEAPRKRTRSMSPWGTSSGFESYDSVLIKKRESDSEAGDW